MFFFISLFRYLNFFAFQRKTTASNNQGADIFREYPQALPVLFRKKYFANFIKLDEHFFCLNNTFFWKKKLTNCKFFSLKIIEKKIMQRLSDVRKIEPSATQYIIEPQKESYLSFMHVSCEFFEKFDSMHTNV